jgi:prepilin-type N-terminal cleavage/methylation domain-containing protein
MSLVASGTRRVHEAADAERGVARARRGMTLVEIIVAMLLLVTVVLALGAFTTKYAMASNQARLVITANEIASTRLDAVKQQPTYSAIDSMGTGRSRTDSVKKDFTWYYVTTLVQQNGGGLTDSTDYKNITVLVSHPGMKKVIYKTTNMAAF